ncbi:type II secretion system protein GspG [bacterium]|nr:type II secretion system protein GspG [bacterium]
MPGKCKLDNERGYSLIELVIVIMIVGVIAGIAVRSLKSSNEVSRTNETVAEMDRLACAIAGDPHHLSGGTRVDYGYIGDVGACPINLDALVSNPGYGTWDGPYIRDELSTGAADYTFKLDAWGAPYVYAGGASIISNGSSSPLTRQLAASTGDLLYNRVSLAVIDQDQVPPGSIYHDSLRLVLTCPDGSGSYRSLVRTPDPNGYVEFDSIPIGLHRLHIVYLPASDTLTRLIPVDPGRDFYTEITLSRELW